jgi:hypothetical protein
MRRAAVFAVALLCVLGQIAACLAADPPKTGEMRDTLIYIRSTPPGAKVFVDGKEVGKTNGLFRVEAGVATVILELEKHGQVKQQVTIPANAITRIVIELRPQTAAEEAQTPPQSLPAKPPIPATSLALMESLKGATMAIFNSLQQDDPKTALAVLDSLMPRAEAWLQQIKGSEIEMTARGALEDAKAIRQALREGRVQDAKIRLRALGESGARIEAEVRKSVAEAHASTAASPARPQMGDRYFVRIVVGMDSMAFEGKETNWKELPELLKAVPNREQTVIEVATASDDVGVKRRVDAIRQALPIARRLGFEYVSHIGVHPLGSKGSPSLKVARLPEQQNAKRPSPEAAVLMMEPLRDKFFEFRRALEANDLETASKIMDRTMPHVDDWLALLKGSPAEPMARAAAESMKAISKAMREGNVEEAKALAKVIDQAGPRLNAEIRQMVAAEGLSAAGREARLLRQAEAGDYWSKYYLWKGYQKGAGGIATDAAKAEKLLNEIVKDVYLVKFRPIKGFAPKTPTEFFAKFKEYSNLSSGPNGLGGAAFPRTKNENGMLIGSYVTVYPDEMRKAIGDNPFFKLVSIEKATPEMFISYEASQPESLH